MCSFSTRNLRLDSTRNLSKLVLDRYYLDPKMFSSYFEILNWKDSISVTVYRYITTESSLRPTPRKEARPGRPAAAALRRARWHCPT